MNMIFLDPNVYCYSEREWEGGAALSRLDRLLEIIFEIDESEVRIEAEQSVKFILPDELLLEAFEMNPTINDPPNSFYNRLFTNRILPALMRRRETSELTDETGVNLADHLVPADSVANDGIRSFLGSISLIQAKSIVYAYHSQRVSLPSSTGFFYDEVPICSVPGCYFVDHHRLFPIEEKSNAERAVAESIRILRERLKKKDSTWARYNTVNVRLHDYFVPSVAKSNFRDQQFEYRERIVYSLLQIATSRSVTTRQHSMKPQKINYNSKSHGKWNAYVFQNGPTDRDTRCSRIYFAKISGGIVLFDYDEDAHS